MSWRKSVITHLISSKNIRAEDNLREAKERCDLCNSSSSNGKCDEDRRKKIFYIFFIKCEFNLISLQAEREEEDGKNLFICLQ